MCHSPVTRNRPIYLTTRLIHNASNLYNSPSPPVTLPHPVHLQRDNPLHFTRYTSFTRHVLHTSFARHTSPATNRPFHITTQDTPPPVTQHNPARFQRFKPLHCTCYEHPLHCNQPLVGSSFTSHYPLHLTPRYSSPPTRVITRHKPLHLQYHFPI